MVKQTKDQKLNTTQVIGVYAKTNHIDLSPDTVNFIAQKLSIFDRDMQIAILDKIDFYSRSYLSDFKKIVKNGGFTDNELYYNGMEIIGNMFRDCNSDDCDLIFADVRACIAFKMIFENFRRFFEVKETDKELFYSEKFSKAYASINPEIYPNILNNYYIQTSSNSNTDQQQPVMRYVIFIGNENTCENICNNAYGVGGWQRIKYEPKLQFNQSEKKNEIIENIEHSKVNDDFEIALREAEQMEENHQIKLKEEEKQRLQMQKANAKWFNEKMQEHNIKPSGDQNQDCFNVALKELEKIL